MDHRRNTQMMQFPTYHHPAGNGVPLPSFPPDFISDGPYLSENTNLSHFTRFTHLPPPLDADQSLSNVFSLLNLSPASYNANPPPFSGQIGSFSGAGEGFVHPMNSPRRIMHSDLGVQRWSDDVFDFDRKSNKTLNFTQHFEQITGNKMKFHKPDDYEQYEQYNPCSSSSQFQNQSQSQSQNNEVTWCFKRLRGRIYTMAKDQNGFRILQAMFENPTLDEVEFVLSEVVGVVSDLMKDQFGNYLVQKLVALCNDDQKMQLILSLVKDIILVCMNPHGTRSVQKLLENLQDTNQVKLVIKALHRGATMLAVDPNGHHVIQFCLVNFPTEVNMPILTEIANECYKIATDRSGCCVLQACVEHTRGEVRTRILAEIMANSVHLAEDPFGNYVLQHMVGLNIPELTALLVRQLQGNFATLSCNKYGSNVVEKCLNESGEGVSTRIVLELVRSPNSSSLLVDLYANFVIQSALKVSKVSKYFQLLIIFLY
ncbi:pumilio homolog 12-like [Bidens hawaiensis]|uniref:pumilio homolog 12-like n=1 Tax=Bidens hawaiensis TaxID=980011 RepID=UPI004048ECB0